MRIVIAIEHIAMFVLHFMLHQIAFKEQAKLDANRTDNAKNPSEQTWIFEENVLEGCLTCRLAILEKWTFRRCHNSDEELFP